MKAFRAFAVLTATTALTFGTVPAFAEVSGNDAVDASGELTLDDDGATVTYDDSGIADSGVGEEAGDPVVDDAVGDPGELVEHKNDDPLPFERELDGTDNPEIMYMMGGAAGEDLASSAADDAAEAAADNAADKALDRVEVASSSRVPANVE